MTQTQPPSPQPDLDDNDSWIGPVPGPMQIFLTRTSASHRHFPVTRTLTPEQLAERLDHWQHQLCLDHWVIDLKICNDLELPNRDGQCHTDILSHRATISLADPDDRHPRCDPYDMEQILVHELLHIHFAFAAQTEWNENSAKAEMSSTEHAVCVEQPIERLAWILIEFDRAQPLHPVQPLRACPTCPPRPT